MVNHSNAEQWWDSLFRYIDDGKVVPIVGRDLLWVDVDGRSVHVPRLLAGQLAEKLHVALPGDLGGDPVDAVVRAYFSLSDHDHERPYSELSALVRALDSRPLPPALVKLAELPFLRFVSTTYDDFLPRAVEAAKGEGDEVTVVVNSLGSSADMPKLDGAGRRVVVQLLGRANPSTDYAITDADVLEFVHRFQRDNQPEHLLNTLRQQHILLVGGGFSDWLTRFLLRLVRVDRLWMNKGLRHFFADKEATRDPRLRSFLEHPLTAAAVFQTDDATVFVDDLHRRWKERPVTKKPARSVASTGGAQRSVADGGVFLSYASEDVASARRVHDRLTAAGIDVWFDRTGFTPGDEWDRVIRTRIERCFLFVPLLSQYTRGPEGYFYKEWRLAAERAERIAIGAKFAFPIVVDDSHVDSQPLPDLLDKVQRTLAKDGALTDEFVRILRDAYRAFQTAGRT